MPELFSRDNLKEAITPLMGHCIQAPKQSKGSKTKGPSTGNQSQALVHWVNVVVIMNDLLESLKMNHCAPFMSQKLFDQLFQVRVCVCVCESCGR